MDQGTYRLHGARAGVGHDLYCSIVDTHVDAHRDSRRSSAHRASAAMSHRQAQVSMCMLRSCPTPEHLLHFEVLVLYESAAKSVGPPIPAHVFSYTRKTPKGKLHVLPLSGFVCLRLLTRPFAERTQIQRCCMCPWPPFLSACAFHVLVIRCLLIVPFPEFLLNDEAGTDLLMHH